MICEAIPETGEAVFEKLLEIVSESAKRIPGFLGGIVGAAFFGAAFILSGSSVPGHITDAEYREFLKDSSRSQEEFFKRCEELQRAVYSGGSSMEAKHNAFIKSAQKEHDRLMQKHETFLRKAFEDRKKLASEIMELIDCELVSINLQAQWAFVNMSPETRDMICSNSPDCDRMMQLVAIKKRLEALRAGGFRPMVFTSKQEAVNNVRN